MMRFAWYGAVILSMIVGGVPGWAGEVNFRLIDALRQTPVEYLQKNQELPAGMLFSRFPTATFVDGKAVNYAAYGGEDKDNLLGGGDAGNDMDRDLVPEPQVESDRKSEVVGNIGVKALVKTEVAVGAHTFVPGGLRFSTTEKDGIATTDPSLLKKTRVTCYVLCYPVDINLLQENGGPGNIDVSVASDNQVIYEETLASARPAALRLYLPLSTTGYTFTLDKFGHLKLSVTKDGVHLLEAPAGLNAVASGFAITVRRGIPPLLAPPPLEGTADSELYLFTDRNREVYVEGEHAQFSLRAWGQAAKTGVVEMWLDSRGVILPLGPVVLKPAGDGAFAEADLDTALLAPGSYTVHAKTGTLHANPISLTLAPLLPATNMKIFSHLKWGDSTDDPAKLNRLADQGFNWLSNSLNGEDRSNAMEPNAILFDAWNGVPVNAQRTDLPGPHFPTELLEGRTPTSHAMETMLARGVQLLNINHGLILYFNVGDNWREQADDRYQTDRHIGMLLRRYPNFAGLTFCTGDGPTPATMGSVFASAGVASFDMLHEERMKKLRDAFEVKYGKLEVDLHNLEKVNQLTEKDREAQEAHGLAWGYKVGEDIRLTVTSDDEKAFLWGQWINDLYPDNFRTLRADLTPMVRDPIVTCGASWGIGAGGGMYPGTFYRALDFSLNDMHGDYGVCNFNEITGSDILSMGMEDAGARPWVALDMIHEREPANGFKLWLQALSRNPSGVGVLNVSQGQWICGWAQNKKQSEELVHLTDLTQRFGDLYAGLERVDEIGVVSSFRQEILGGQPFRALWAAHFITQKAGYQANILSDAYCAKHQDELRARFRALFLFRMTKPLSPGVRLALDNYRKAGGILLIDKSTTVEIPGAVRLPFSVPDDHGPSNSNDHLEFEEYFLPFINQFRATVGPLFTPHFSFSSQRKPLHHAINWMSIRSRSGDLEYWTIVNDGKPNIKDGTFAQFLYEGDSAAVTAASSGVLYDALRRAPVATQTPPNMLAFTCDGLHYPGTIYLLAPRPIVLLEVAASPTVAQGQAVKLRARALDAAKQAFTGLLPVEFTITDPTGAIRYHLFRTTNRELLLKIAANDPPGTWTWQAAEQATGLQATGTFSVNAGAGKAHLTPLEETIFDPDAIYRLLHHEVTVALTSEEVALRPQALALVEGLKARGVNAVLHDIPPSETRYYPMQWAYKTVEDREVFDGVQHGDLLGYHVQGKNHLGDFRTDNFGNFAYYKHYTGSTSYMYSRDVILLGRQDVTPGPLLQTILRGRMLLRNPSPSFPASGQGMVAYAWGAFQAHHDAIVVYGNGREGLDRAIASVLTLAGRKEVPAPAFIPAMPRRAMEDGLAYRELGIAAVESAQATVTSDVRVKISLLPPTYPSTIVEATTDSQGRVIVLRQDLVEGVQGVVTHGVVAQPGKDDARLYTLPNSLTPASAEALAWHVGPGQEQRWPATTGVSVGDQYIAPGAFGVGRYRLDGTPVWHYDPYPLTHSYNETKYPRRVRNVAVSADGTTALAAFYSKTPTQEIPFRHNRCDVALLDAITGKLLATVPNYHGDWLLPAHDGSRFAIIDLFHDYPWEHNHREFPNPHDTTGLGVFDRTGKELHFFPLPREVDNVAVDAQISLAVVTFSDAGRHVALLDLTTGAAQDYRYPRVDVGVAVAPDGRFAVITFSDGAVHCLDRAGVLLWKTNLPIAGKPVILAKDDRILVAGPDDALYQLDAQGKLAGTQSLAAARIAPLTATPHPLPATLDAPAPIGWWDAPPDGVKVTPLANVACPLPATLTGTQTITVTLPPLKPLQTVLLAFTYRLHSLADRLDITVKNGELSVVYPFLAHAEAWPAAIPLRFPDGGVTTLTFTCRDKATLAGVKLLLTDAGVWHNAAATREDMPPKNAPLPRLMVYNVFGLLGDPRVEQLCSGLKTTEIYRCFDGDVYNGTKLYDTKFPLNTSWDGGAEPDLRSARILLEFREPRTILGLGLWAQPGDLPVESWTLECCDSYTEEKQMTHELKGNWKLVTAGRGNTQVYALQGFKPTRARIWRLTLVRTPAQAQYLAECELFENALDNVGDGGDDTADTGDLGLAK